ncbi:sigma-70 family RNA polymerase sigma factor [Pseudenhygromyxa sp. WMMC2535]|uniref:sigma-70 family RNA polymerase sigma factor n=1 Tax=Pseudenhygromyxa sp. WMMC2535 TaxID=2712867 RepID=UPI001556268C|nr:sigma-70 family RNA polymerase sigma factor [Pseudenhygromyxa sp. WMMC2535]NVB42769.1 sigma-70 family RNA polymerase sigma factor [Pseudenhygromyxa sp. WMMC2535]
MSLRWTEDEEDEHIARVVHDKYEDVVECMRRWVREPDAEEVAEASLAVFLARDLELARTPDRLLWIVVCDEVRRYYEGRCREVFVRCVVDVLDLPVAMMDADMVASLGSARELDAALLGLPLRQMMAFDLRYVLDFSLDDAASALGRSLAGIKRDLDAAGKWITKALGLVERDETTLRALAKRER